MATTVTAPLERQFGELQGLSQMTSTSSGGTSVIVLQFNLSSEHRCGRGRGAVRHQRVAEFVAVDPARAADLQQDESSRCPGAHAGHHLELHAAFSGRGPGGHAACAEDFAAQRRRPGNHQRRPKARGPHSGQPDGAVVLRHQHGRPAHGADPGQRERRQRELRRAAPGLPDRRQRSAGHQRRLSERCRCLPQRRAGDADRRGAAS